MRLSDDTTLGEALGRRPRGTRVTDGATRADRVAAVDRQPDESGIPADHQTLPTGSVLLTRSLRRLLHIA